MVFAGIILATGRDTDSLGPLENLKSIHVHFQNLMIYNAIKNLVISYTSIRPRYQPIIMYRVHYYGNDPQQKGKP